MAGKAARKSEKKIQTLRGRKLSAKREKRVKGGVENTKHPAKVTVLDIKLTVP